MWYFNFIIDRLRSKLLVAATQPAEGIEQNYVYGSYCKELTPAR